MKLKYIKILAVGSLLVLAGCNEINPDNYKKVEPVSVGAGETNVNKENPVTPPETGDAIKTETDNTADTANNTPPVTAGNTVASSSYADYSQELELNALGAKPLILFFSANDCAECDKLDSDIKDNISALQNAVILKADFVSGSQLAAKYRVDEVNTVVFVDKDGGSYNKKTGANINDIRNFLNTDR